MSKYLIFIGLNFFTWALSAQTVRFSYGFDMFYFPDITPKFTQYSESYKIEAIFKITPKFSFGASYRYAGISGNFPFVLDDYPNLGNTDPRQEKYVDYKEFDRGIYTNGLEGQHWGQFINLVGIDIYTKLYNHKDKLWIDFSLGSKLEFYKENYLRVIVGDQINGGILTSPEGEKVIVQFHTYNVVSSLQYVANTSLSLNKKVSTNAFVYLGTDFNYIFSGDAYWFLDLGIGYKL